MDNSKNLNNLVAGDNVYLAIQGDGQSIGHVYHSWPGFYEFVKVSEVRDGRVFFEKYPMFSIDIGKPDVFRDERYRVGRIDHEKLGWSDKEVAEEDEKDDLIGGILYAVDQKDLSPLPLEKLKQIAAILATL